MGFWVQDSGFRVQGLGFASLSETLCSADASICHPGHQTVFFNRKQKPNRPTWSHRQGRRNRKGHKCGKQKPKRVPGSHLNRSTGSSDSQSRPTGSQGYRHRTERQGYTQQGHNRKGHKCGKQKPNRATSCSIGSGVDLGVLLDRRLGGREGCESIRNRQNSHGYK